MIRSMTAYGRGEYAQDRTIFIAEIKSLNNRYRDIVLRLPASLQGLEDEIRSRVAAATKRGRIEVSVQMEIKDEGMGYCLELNRPLIKSYLKIYEHLCTECTLDEKINPEWLLQMKDVILMKPLEIDLVEAAAGVGKAMGRALDSLDSMRLREGRAIEEDFLKRLLLIERTLDGIEKRAPTLVDEYKEKLRHRVDQISEDIRVDEGRLAQEVAIFASRCDITEEIVRIKSHLDQFRNYLSGDDAMGRRLDFLVQEINREINTISAKASDSFISANAIEVKAELEKLKEQIQNVE